MPSVESPDRNIAICPLCQGSRVHLAFAMPIDAKTFDPTRFGQVYACEACGFRFVWPRPAAEEAAAFYAIESYYTQGKSHMVEAPSAGLLSRLRMHLAWRADGGEYLVDVITRELAPGAAIADIGCGGGALLGELARRGYKATGVERDIRAIALQDPRIAAYQGSAEELPPELARGSYDGVVFSHVLEHISEPKLALSAAVQLLRPGGLLFIEVPNNGSLIAGQSGLSWEHLDIPRHINFFTMSTLINTVAGVGMRLHGKYYSGYCRYFSDSFILTEQNIHDRLPAGAGPSIRNSGLRAWLLLLRSCATSNDRKYDSIGVVAEKPY